MRDGMGQGRVLGADTALAQNMVDGVATFGDVVRKMRRNAKAGVNPSASPLGQARNALTILCRNGQGRLSNWSHSILDVTRRNGGRIAGGNVSL